MSNKSKSGEGSKKVKEPDELFEVYCIMAARWQGTSVQVSDDDDEDNEPKSPRPPPWQWHYRIRWYGYSSDEDTYEPEHEINKQCSGLVRRFWKHLNLKSKKASHHVEHLAKGFWISQEMRAFEDLKGVDQIKTSDESEYDSPSDVSEGASAKSKPITRSAKTLGKQPKREVKGDAGIKPKSKKNFAKRTATAGPSLEASSSAQRPKTNPNQDLPKKRKPTRVESDIDSDDDVPLARMTTKQRKPLSATGMADLISSEISGSGRNELFSSQQPLPSISVGSMATSPAVTVEKAQIKAIPSLSIPPISSSEAKRPIVPSSSSLNIPESNTPAVPGVNRHRGNKVKMLAVPPKPLPPEAPAPNRWTAKRFGKANPTQPAAKAKPENDKSTHSEPKVPAPPSVDLTGPSSSTWKPQKEQPGRLFIDDNDLQEPPLSPLFDDGDHMDVDSSLLSPSNQVARAELNESTQLAQSKVLPSQQLSGHITLLDSDKTRCVPFQLGAPSYGPERHEPLAKALDNLKFEFEKLLPVMVISNLLSQLGQPRNFCVYPVGGVTGDVNRLSKLALFLSGTDQIGIGSRQIPLEYISILLPSQIDFVDQLGQWFPGFLRCNTPLMIVVFDLQSSSAGLDSSTLTNQRLILNSGGPSLETDDPTFPLVTTLLGITDEHKSWLRGTRFGMYPDETPERMSFDAWALSRFLEGAMKCQRVPLTDSKAKHVIIHSKGRNSIGLIHKLRERRREGPQVAFWRYGWDIDTSLSEANLRSVYRTGGIITFTPAALIKTPERAEDIIRQALLDEHWDYYISPATIALVQQMRLSKFNHEAQNQIDSAMLTLLKTHKHGRHLFLGSPHTRALGDGLALALERYRLSNLPTLEFLREADDILKRDYSQVIQQAQGPMDLHHPKLLSPNQIMMVDKAIEKGLITDMTAMQIQPDLDGFRRFVVITASPSTMQVGNSVEQVFAKDFKFHFPPAVQAPK